MKRSEWRTAAIKCLYGAWRSSESEGGSDGGSSSVRSIVVGNNPGVGVGGKEGVSGVLAEDAERKVAVGGGGGGAKEDARRVPAVDSNVR